MPRTASTQNLDRAQHHRPSARLRSQSAIESTPVLFRLPTIEPLVAPSEVPSESSRQEAVQVPDEPQPGTEPEAVVAPTLATETAVVPTAVLETEVERSWWEHWSSGVVLILLIIALITATIVAFSDAGPTDPDMLADFVEEDGGAVGDLSSIKIPDVQLPSEPAAQTMPTIELPADNAVGLGDSAKTSSVAEPLQEASVEDTQIPEVHGLVLGDLEFDKLELTEGSSSSVNSTKTAQVIQNPPVASQLLPTLPEPQKPVAAPQANVSLSQPLGAQALPLFPEPIGATPPKETTNGGATDVAGRSPALYDEALTNTPLPAAVPSTIQDDATPPNRSSGPMDTNLPAYSSLLTGTSSTTTNFTTAGHQTEAVGEQSTASQEKASSPPGVQRTATPESEADAIIRAWQEYNSLHQAETNASNRYVPTQGSQAAGGVQSYTLGNQSQPTSSAQPH